MVRILSPIEFPVDWKQRVVKEKVIYKVNNKKKDSSELTTKPAKFLNVSKRKPKRSFWNR